MSDAIATKSAANEWSRLLQETRLALTTLRAQDLDDLTARAESMSVATVGQDSIRQRIPNPGPRELLGVTREHRLLSDLLVATDRNLNVLRRLRGYSRTPAGEANSRWVR